MPVTTLVKQGAFDADLMNTINTNFADCVLLDATGQVLTHGLQVNGTLTAEGASNLVGLATISKPLGATVYTGTTDAVDFSQAINVAIFTSTGPEAATLATPATADNGRILVLINTNTTQTTVTTASNKILNGTATPGDTLTAPAHAGAICILVAGAQFWNLIVGGTGTWVLSEV